MKKNIKESTKESTKAKGKKKEPVFGEYDGIFKERMLTSSSVDVVGIITDTLKGYNSKAAIVNCNHYKGIDTFLASYDNDKDVMLDILLKSGMDCDRLRSMIKDSNNDNIEDVKYVVSNIMESISVKVEYIDINPYAKIVFEKDAVRIKSDMNMQDTYRGQLNSILNYAINTGFIMIMMYREDFVGIDLEYDKDCIYSIIAAMRRKNREAISSAVPGDIVDKLEEANVCNLFGMLVAIKGMNTTEYEKNIAMEEFVNSFVSDILYNQNCIASFKSGSNM